MTKGFNQMLEKSNVPDMYENIKKKIRNILKENPETREKFCISLLAINAKINFEMTEENLIENLSIAIMTRPIEEAFFPDHPFYNHKDENEV